ncbi:MAG: hypothetical protein V7L26_15125 [Nostoc sp.]|uniref:hypothetical protein n=1 Tax=Nostoc sp. TaxID=1180 RepID=UPI002FF2D68F
MLLNIVKLYFGVAYSTVCDWEDRVISDRSLFFSGDREVRGLTWKIFKRVVAIAGGVFLAM